jgi:hypothetical protein
MKKKGMDRIDGMGVVGVHGVHPVNLVKMSLVTRFHESIRVLIFSTLS